MKKYVNCFEVGPFEQYSRKVYTTEQGLRSNQATALAFDKKGVLYVGTKKGLSRLEGDKFVNVDTGKESEITMLYCADNNHVFVGAENILIEFNHRIPPITLDVILKFNTILTIIVDCSESIVNLARREYKTILLAVSDKFLEQLLLCHI